MEKKSIELHVMWHINSLMHSYPITLVTSIRCSREDKCRSVLTGYSFLFISKESPDAAYCQQKLAHGKKH